MGIAVRDAVQVRGGPPANLRDVVNGHDYGMRPKTLLVLLLMAALLTACSGWPFTQLGQQPQTEAQCPKVNAALGGQGVAHQWSGFPWHEYGFDNVTIPADIGRLRLGGVSCTEDNLAGKVTSVFTDLYEPGGNRKKAAALLLVGVDDPADPETWEQYLNSTFPGRWQYERTGSVLVARPAQDG